MVFLKSLNTRRYTSIAVIFSLVSIFAVFISPVYSDWEGDIDEITEELDRDFKFGGKEEIKAENLEQANTQLREDAQIENKADNTLSPLSGTYLSANGFVTFNFEVFESGRFKAVGTGASFPNRTFELSGTVTGNQSSYTVTLTLKPGPPNFLTPCSESTPVTGVFSGAGEVGTTHTFSRGALCDSPVIINGTHIKIS